MNTVLLQPTDVLFFRDGRPMTGSLAGHGAAWPLPNVVNTAFHAALHRADLSGVHAHDQISRNGERKVKDIRKFGALVTAGPFPVLTGERSAEDTWFLPTPADLLDKTLLPGMLPSRPAKGDDSSLPKPLRYPVASRVSPSKDNRVKRWISAEAYRRYLDGGSNSTLATGESASDADFTDTEHAIGIAIDPNTGTTGQGETEGMIYSAHYLRLRDRWRLGVCAAARDKDYQSENGDLVKALLTQNNRIVAGGQQRVCTAKLCDLDSLPIPRGRHNDFYTAETEVGKRWLVKWILLTPAVWPEILDKSKDGRPMTPHQGGWLPNWVAENSGDVLLRYRSGKIRRDYSGKKPKRTAETDEPINAKLVSAVVPKPIIVTGWTLPFEKIGEKGGAQSTHLAVPAGAVYFFEAGSEADARKLAAALNWHGETAGTEIRNRRSTLLGEKGYGLGVCGTWEPYKGPSDL